MHFHTVHFHTVCSLAQRAADTAHGVWHSGEPAAVAGDRQTLLYAVPKGSKHALHCIAVRVVDDDACAWGAAEASAGAEAGHLWSPPVSLLPGPALSAAQRAFRAGPYDLAIDIAPVQSAAAARTKVVTFVQR